MAYIGDFRLGKTFDTKFCTVATTGAPTQLAGTPVISAYLDNNTTQLTAGITLTVDFDGVTGLNNVRVVATSGNGYATATNYQLVITTGTVGGTSVVGYVIAEFSIEARSALMPTTADATLDVAAGGEAGIDWGNVANKTTANALTNTSIITTQKVDVDTIKTNPVVNGGTITFPTTATLASTTNITAATGVDITKILGTAISTPATAGILDVNVKNMNNVAGTPITTIKAVQGLTTADTVVTVSGNVNGSVASVTGAVGSVTGAVGSLTTNNDKTGYTLSNTGMDNILDRAAGVETNFTLRQALRLILAAAASKLSGAATTTVTIRDINDTKARITATVDADGNRSAVTTDVT